VDQGTKERALAVGAEGRACWQAGERLIYRYTNEEDGKTLRRYWTTTLSARNNECFLGLFLLDKNKKTKKSTL
jgi:hypothetical protein